MIKRLSLFILPLTLLFSCYQDLSTTADKVIPEIEISGIPDSLETYFGEEIALHATVTLGGEAYDGFDYAWAIDLKPGNSRDRIDISETADIAYRVANQPNETPYCLSFTATDRESGLFKTAFCHVFVRSSLGEGILVAHTRDGGETTDFDLLANKYVTYGYTSDVPRYTRDIYQLANGQPVNGKVNAVLPVVRSDGAVYNETLILVGTDEHLLALDPLTFKVAKQDGALFNGYKEPTFEVHNLINYGQIMTAAQINGKLWLNICHTNNIFNIAGYSGIPADVFTPTNVGYAYAVQQSDIAFFNEAEGKFYYMHAQFSGYSSFALVTDPVGADLAGGKSLWAGAGKEGRCAFLIQAADGRKSPYRLSPPVRKRDDLLSAGCEPVAHRRAVLRLLRQCRNPVHGIGQQNRFHRRHRRKSHLQGNKLATGRQGGDHHRNQVLHPGMVRRPRIRLYLLYLPPRHQQDADHHLHL